ncbi:MAG: tetratricopeptide repeat protein [Acidobacteriota bacterium]
MIWVPLLVVLAQSPEATSLLGRPLVSASVTNPVLLENYEKAKKAYEAEPERADNLIWLGRRLGYLGRFQEAITVFSRGIELEPANPRFYRHRGHRYLTTRQIDKAIADFRRAADLTRGQADEIEPDGQPNRLNKPLSTLQFNIWYHLGLAYYLKGDFGAARKAYLECMKRSRANDDSLVASSDWLYMTLRRMGRNAEAARLLEPIHEKMDIIENASYWNRLLMYKGLRTPESVLAAESADDLTIATQGYGVGNWYLYNGQQEKAGAIFEKVVGGKQWAAFGYLAAEAELGRKKPQ